MANIFQYRWQSGKRANFKMGITKKQNTFFSKNKNTHMCVPEGRKGLLFGKFGVLSFPVIPVLRFALLLYYWQYVEFHLQLQVKNKSKTGCSRLN